MKEHHPISRGDTFFKVTDMETLKMVEYYVLHTKRTIFTNAQCVPQQTHCTRPHHSITTLLKALLSLCYVPGTKLTNPCFLTVRIPTEQLQNEAL